MNAQSALDQFRQSLTSIETAHEQTLQLLETTRAQLQESENRDYAQLFADVLRKLDDKQSQIDKQQQALADKQGEIDEHDRELARAKRELRIAIVQREEALAESRGRGWTWDRRDGVWRCCGCHGEECECVGRSPVWRASRGECDEWGKLGGGIRVADEGEGRADDVDSDDDGGLFVPLGGGGVEAEVRSSHTLWGDGDDDVVDA